jgi:hypothetical protein
VRSDGRIVDFWVDDSGQSILFSVIQNGLQQTLVLPVDATRPKLLKDFKTGSMVKIFKKLLDS